MPTYNKFSLSKRYAQNDDKQLHTREIRLLPTTISYFAQSFTVRPWSVLILRIGIQHYIEGESADAIDIYPNRRENAPFLNLIDQHNVHSLWRVLHMTGKPPSETTCQLQLVVQFFNF